MMPGLRTQCVLSALWTRGWQGEHVLPVLAGALHEQLLHWVSV